MKAPELLSKPEKLRHLHAVATVIWFVAVVPTVVRWKDSVLWVALMSCWANAAAHFSAWQGARSEQASEN